MAGTPLSDRTDGSEGILLKKWFRTGFVLSAIAAVWLAASFVHAASPAISRLTIHGNKKADDSRVHLQTGLQPDRPLPSDWPEGPVRRLLDWYRGQDHYLVRVDSTHTRYTPDSLRVDLEIWITEGPLLKLHSIHITGVDEPLRTALMRLMDSREGMVFRQHLLEGDIQAFLDYGENHGYPLMTVRIDSFGICWPDSAPSVDMRLTIDPGEEITIGDIRVSGNELTRSRVILRESRLVQGSVYCQEHVRLARDNLQRLGYFREVEEPQVLFIRDKAVITIPVKEGNPNTMDGLVGYNPPATERDQGYFTGRLAFDFRNLLGTGRYLEAFWEKKDRFSQAMRFGYEEPWLLDLPLHLGGLFSQEIRDSTYVERNWRLTCRYAPWTTLNLLLEGGQKEILPDSLGAVYYGIPPSSAWVITAGFDYSTLNDALNPTRGVRYRSRLSLGQKTNQPADTALTDVVPAAKKRVFTRHVQMDAEFLLPLLQRQVLYFGLHGQEIRTGDTAVPVSDQIRFGGATTLRGYPEDAFRGTLAAWLNTEFRFLLGRHSRAFLFVDTGIYERDEIRSTKWGYGFGIRLETRLGLFGVDYGLGEGDKLMQGKIHVGLVNRF